MGKKTSSLLELAENKIRGIISIIQGGVTDANGFRASVNKAEKMLDWPLASELTRPAAASLLATLYYRLGVYAYEVAADEGETSVALFVKSSHNAQIAINRPMKAYVAEQAEAKTILATLYTFGIVGKEGKEAHEAFTWRLRGDLPTVASEPSYRDDYAKAIKLYEEAGACHEPHALKELAKIYFDGRGTPRSLPKAMKCISEAYNHGDRCSVDEFNEIETAMEKIAAAYQQEYGCWSMGPTCPAKAAAPKKKGKILPFHR